MRQNRGFFMAILAAVGLTAVLAFFALRVEKHLSSIETQVLGRAPTAPPLRTLEAGPEVVATGQTVYVPVYSHIYSRGGREKSLEVTLSIRNTDPERPIIVTSIRYYDTDGKLLKEYLDAKVLLEPLASTDFLVEGRDTSGGAGANFLVDWVAQEHVSEPIIEAVMVSSEGNQAFSFVRPGRPIKTVTAED